MPALKSHQKRLLVGLTGGIATGKSEVLRLLARRHIPTLSSDRLVHEAYRRGQPLYRSIVRHFGSSILDSHHRIDRQALGRIVFSRSAERRRLEKLVHPYVLKMVRQFARRHTGVIVVDIPLLFEAQWEKYVDRIVVVDCPLSLQLVRLERRDGMIQAEALKRIRAQLPLSLKKRHADWVLTNTGSRADLQQKTLTLIAWLRQQFLGL